MDFQFTRHLGTVAAKCSMEHEALANWFNTEVRSNSALISTALSAVQQAKRFSLEREISLIGAEYSLFIYADEVMIRANSLAMEDNQLQELEEDFYYYDAESIAFCGLEDFEKFLNSYLAFIA